MFCEDFGINNQSKIYAFSFFHAEIGMKISFFILTIFCDVFKANNVWGNYSSENINAKQDVTFNVCFLKFLSVKYFLKLNDSRKNNGTERQDYFVESNTLKIIAELTIFLEGFYCPHHRFISLATK